jgi:hypothetical protein
MSEVQEARAFEETHHFAEHFAVSILARCLLIVGLCLFVTGVVNAQTPDPSPVDAKQPGVRPALGPFPRFEDWSFLRDPSQRVDPYDRLKFIPLNESGTNYLTLSVESRTEFQYLYHCGAVQPEVRVCDFAASLWVLRPWHGETSL